MLPIQGAKIRHHLKQVCSFFVEGPSKPVSVLPTCNGQQSTSLIEIEETDFDAMRAAFKEHKDENKDNIRRKRAIGDCGSGNCRVHQLGLNLWSTDFSSNNTHKSFLLSVRNHKGTMKLARYLKSFKDM